MRIAVVTLFPEMFDAITDYGVSGRAVKQGLIELKHFNPRDWTRDKHQTVDDRPYGGGPGMVMKVQPLQDALAAAKTWAQEDQSSDLKATQTIYLSPQGAPLQQAMAQEMAEAGNLVLLAGRYEGVDERLLEREIDREISIGDYVLSGGELAAMVLVDAVTRLIPGALGHAQSAEQDSFSEGLLDCPHYTRPESFQGEAVPAVLMSGNHESIRRWRLKQALGRTWQRRPDLLEKIELSEEQRALLTDYRRDLENAKN